MVKNRFNEMKKVMMFRIHSPLSLSSFMPTFPCLFPFFTIFVSTNRIKAVRKKVFKSLVQYLNLTLILIHVRICDVDQTCFSLPFHIISLPKTCKAVHFGVSPTNLNGTNEEKYQKEFISQGVHFDGHSMCLRCFEYTSLLDNDTYQ